jgi:hypothetical protein
VDKHRFAVLTRYLISTPSRRDVLRSLGAAGLVLGAGRSAELAGAKKKRKRKTQWPPTG